MFARRHAVMHHGLGAEAGRVQHTNPGALGTQPSHELIAVEARHHHVGDHQIGLESAIDALRESFFAAAGGHHAIPATFEHPTGDRTNARLVINEQHGRLSPRKR